MSFDNTSGKRPRLLLILPTFHGYEDKIVLAARNAGYDCLRVDERIGNGIMAKTLTRLGILQRIRPVMRRYLDRLIRTARDFDPDIVLVINAETLNEQAIARLREETPRARYVIYMWDSSSKKNIPAAMYRRFDRACSFDPDDCRRIDGLIHIPLFHMHDRPSWADGGYPGEHEVDCTFIGTARMRRMKILADAARQLEASGKRHFFYLYAPSIPHYILFSIYRMVTGYRGILSRRAMPYPEYLDRIAGSATCIDIEQSDQNGLTMRTLEVVFSGRPLVTTNRWAKAYDFYDSFPVSVFSPDEPLALPSGEPGQRAESLFERYSLASWLRTVLGNDTPRFIAQATVGNSAHTD